MIRHIKIVEEISKELNIPEDKIEKIINEFYSNLKKEFRKMDQKDILVHYLGRFKTNTQSIKYAINNLKSSGKYPEQLEKLLKIYND